MQRRNIKNLRIIRVLLSEPKGDLTKYRIAKKAGCSLPWVIEFLRNLESKGIVRNTKVLDIDSLVDHYLKVMPKIKYFDFYTPEPFKLLEDIDLSYALTTYAAENFITRQLFITRYDIYIIESQFENWKKKILKNGLIGKGNLRLIFSYDEDIIKEAKSIKKINLVSKEMLLIDLKREGGVCMESYSLLKSQSIRLLK